MSTKVFAAIVSFSSATGRYDNKISYVIGGIMALLILGYLVYTLLHPEKF
jgi:K+-transporting ATPase KdpF subunit